MITDIVVLVCCWFALSHVVQCHDFLRCRACRDVDNPKSCSGSIVCGHNELCVSREMTNHLGQHGFFLGCETKYTCDLLRVAQAAFGRRRGSPGRRMAAPHPATCHECCDSEDCNSDLCHDAIGSSLTQLPHQTQQGFITCRECQEVDDPRACVNTTVCGYGEECVASEFTNHVNKRVFRLGCDSQQICKMIKAAEVAFGRRDARGDTPLCHTCCDTSQCNAQLCLDAVVTTTTAIAAKSTTVETTTSSTTVPTTSTTVPTISTTVPKTVPTTSATIPTTSTSTPTGGCPDYFWGSGSSCYMLGPVNRNWSRSRGYCQGQGGDLMVLNSQQEHDYLRQELQQMNVGDISYFWVGGVYSQPAGEWEWMDRSVTPWTSSGLAPHPSNTENMCAILLNPPFGPSSVNATLSYVPCSYTAPSVCEIHRSRA